MHLLLPPQPGLRGEAQALTPAPSFSCTGRHCSTVVVATRRSATAEAGVGASEGAQAELSSMEESFFAACWRFLVDAVRRCHRSLLLPRHAPLLRCLLISAT